MSIELHHGTISWAEDAEPPFGGKVHVIFEDTEGDVEMNCTAACGIAAPDYLGMVDFVGGPVTCKRCLRVRPGTLDKLRERLGEEFDELWDEIKRNPRNEVDLQKEAVHVATMAMRFLIDCCDEPN